MQTPQIKANLLLPKNFHTSHYETSPFYPLPARKRMMRYKPSLADEFINKLNAADEISLCEYLGIENLSPSRITLSEDQVIYSLLKKNAVYFNYQHQYHPEFRREILGQILTQTKVKNVKFRGYILQFDFEALLPESTKAVMLVATTFIEVLLKQPGKSIYQYLSEQLEINGTTGIFTSFDYFLLRFNDLWSRCELQRNKLIVERMEHNQAIISCISVIKRNSKSRKEEINTKIKLQKRNNWWTIYSLESKSFPKI